MRRASNPLPVLQISQFKPGAASEYCTLPWTQLNEVFLVWQSCNNSNLSSMNREHPCTECYVYPLAPHFSTQVQNAVSSPWKNNLRSHAMTYRQPFSLCVFNLKGMRFSASEYDSGALHWNILGNASSCETHPWRRCRIYAPPLISIHLACQEVEIPFWRWARICYTYVYVCVYLHIYI